MASVFLLMPCRMFSSVSTVPTKVRSGASQGAGLGLSIVRAICQALGGTVSIQSVEGIGTTVMVELPLPDASVWENVHAAV